MFKTRVDLSVYIGEIALYIANSKCSGLIHGRLHHCKFNILEAIFYASEDAAVYEAA